MPRLRPRITYANVVATVALFIALGGVGFAASRLPRNSVGTRQLKTGAVTGPKLAHGSVTQAKVAPGSLSRSDFPPGSIGTIGGIDAGTDLTGGGSSGTVTLNADETRLQHRLDGGCATGEAIRSVAQGGQSTCQLVGFTQITLRSASNAATGSSATVSCQAAETLVGGGGQSQVQAMLASIPSGQGWSVAVQNPQASGTITAYALCAR